MLQNYLTLKEEVFAFDWVQFCYHITYHEHEQDLNKNLKDMCEPGCIHQKF